MAFEVNITGILIFDPGLTLTGKFKVLENKVASAPLKFNAVIEIISSVGPPSLLTLTYLVRCEILAGVKPKSKGSGSNERIPF